MNTIQILGTLRFTKDDLEIIARCVVGFVIFMCLLGYYYVHFTTAGKSEAYARANPKVGDIWVKLGGKIGHDEFYGEVIAVDVNPFRVTLFNELKHYKPTTMTLSEFDKLIDDESLIFKPAKEAAFLNEQ